MSDDVLFLKESFLVKPIEVASILGVSLKQVYVLISLGSIEVVNMSPGARRPTYRVKSASVLRFLGEEVGSEAYTDYMEVGQTR